MESLGEGKRPEAVIGKIADYLNLDLVVLKHGKRSLKAYF